MAKLRIGAWPFKRAGVDCRTCLREPCRCPKLFFPVLLRGMCERCDWLAGDPMKEAGICLRYCIRHCPGPHRPAPGVTFALITRDRSPTRRRARRR